MDENVKAFKDIYFVNLFLSHTLSVVRPDVCSYRGMVNYYRNKPYYTYNCAINYELTTPFDGSKDVYTEVDLNDYDKDYITNAVNHVVLTDIATNSVPYKSLYKKNKKFIDYLEDVAKIRVPDNVETYIQKVADLTGGRLHIVMRISNAERMLKDMLEEGHYKCIELSQLGQTKVTLLEALTLALKHDRSDLTGNFKSLLNKWQDTGFMKPEILVEGIINQQINGTQAYPDDSLHRFIMTLTELAFTKQLSIDQFTDSLDNIKERFNGLKSLSRKELQPIANYFCKAVFNHQKKIWEETAPATASLREAEASVKAPTKKVPTLEELGISYYDEN